MGVTKIESAEQFNELLKANKKVVVDFYADWCGPCKRIAPEIDALSEEMTDVAFVKVDVDDLDDIAAEYEVSAMPTFLFFVDGEKKDSVVGASLPAIKEKLAAL